MKEWTTKDPSKNFLSDRLISVPALSAFTSLFLLVRALLHMWARVPHPQEWSA
jgi:hypothetical protein